MNKIDTNQVLKMHSMLINKIGGRDGVRDFNILESALQAPFHTFFGEDFYPTIEQKAARLCYGLIKNHSFYDGNKRIGVLVFLTFLEINNVQVKYTDNELISIGISISSDKMSYEDLVNNIYEHKLEQENCI